MTKLLNATILMAAFAVIIIAPAVGLAQEGDPPPFTPPTQQEIDQMIDEILDNVVKTPFGIGEEKLKEQIKEQIKETMGDAYQAAADVSSFWTQTSKFQWISGREFITFFTAFWVPFLLFFLSLKGIRLIPSEGPRFILGTVSFILFFIGCGPVIRACFVPMEFYEFTERGMETSMYTKYWTPPLYNAGWLWIVYLIPALCFLINLRWFRNCWKAIRGKELVHFLLNDKLREAGQTAANAVRRAVGARPATAVPAAAGQGVNPPAQAQVHVAPPPTVAPPTPAPPIVQVPPQVDPRVKQAQKQEVDWILNVLGGEED